MFSWAPYALVRVALLFTAGIISGVYFPDLFPVGTVTFLFTLLVVVFTFIAYLQWNGKLKYINVGVLGMLAVFLAGSINVYYATDYHRADHFIHDREKIAHYQVLIAKQAQEKENSWKVEAEVQAVEHESGSWIPRSGKVLLYFPKKVYARPFQYGDVLVIRGNPELLKEPSNPGEFDYKKFLTYRKTYHQQFLREDDAIKISYKPSSQVVAQSIIAREWADRALKKYVQGKQEQATASALVLGVTDGLDNDLIGAYAATGSLHVLSVSGLHVGIIYWLILLVFRPLTKTANGKWFLAIFSILVLWGYAFVTGLSPSVLRAVTMFSFVALARPWRQMTNIYNTLAASAFCLLLYEPYLVMSVGFQLSYLAVVGIVYLQPKLARVWEPKAWLWDQVWQITCVSIAAQAATVALGLLYFHQFPVYFLFSNLFVIPISFVVLLLGIVVVLVSFITPVAVVLGFLLQYTIGFLNYGIFNMEAFPYSLIDHVYITTFQCWLLMAAIVCMVLLFELRKTIYLTVASVFILVFAGFQWTHFADNISQKKFVVYNVSGHTAWDVMDNGQVYFFSDSVLINDRDKLRFHIRPNRLRNGAGEIYNGKEQAFSREISGCRLTVWNGVRILQLDKKDFQLPENLQVDYVVLGRNAIRNVHSLKSIKFGKLILDSSNSFYFAERVLKDAEIEQIEVHSVPHQGAFIAKI